MHALIKWCPAREIHGHLCRGGIRQEKISATDREMNWCKLSEEDVGTYLSYSRARAGSRNGK